MAPLRWAVSEVVVEPPILVEGVEEVVILAVVVAPIMEDSHQVVAVVRLVLQAISIRQLLLILVMVLL
jgi:hypothetical protein